MKENIGVLGWIYLLKVSLLTEQVIRIIRGLLTSQLIASPAMAANPVSHNQRSTSVVDSTPACSGRELSEYACFCASVMTVSHSLVTPMRTRRISPFWKVMLHSLAISKMSESLIWWVEKVEYWIPFFSAQLA